MLVILMLVILVLMLVPCLTYFYFGFMIWSLRICCPLLDARPHYRQTCIRDSRPNINDHIHLIFPHDPLAARPVIRPSKKRVSVASLRCEIVHKNTWYYQPLKTKSNSIPTNHRQGVGVVGFCIHARFYWMHEKWKGGLCWFGISLQIPGEVTSPNIADTT